MKNRILYKDLLNLTDNHGDNQTFKNKKAAHFTPLLEKVVGPPGLEPGTT